LAANTTFAGTVIDDAGVAVGANTTWSGRALAFGGTVTTDTDTISVPTCTATTTTSSSPNRGSIAVIKQVINDNGGTSTVANFPLYVNGTPVTSGMSNDFSAPAGVYTVTERTDERYTQTFSGDCDLNGRMNLNPGDVRICIVTNNDIGAPVAVPPVPPLIDVVKIPSPLSLPNGPGLVEYTYTLRNIGTVPVADVTMVGDTCIPIVLMSGDTDADSRLDTTETWVYRCTTQLNETHTNTVVATGWANSISAVDIASASVVVGLPVVPPLIHVTKVPSPLTLAAGGGVVTYTKHVTNPGTVALNNVYLTDDMCSSVVYVSGDINGDTKLDTSETWTYTCQTTLSRTTTNTVTASGEANGLTARDFAVATVIVAAIVPKLPNTGFASTNTVFVWSAFAAALTIGAALWAARRKSRVR
jgi:uncharacterized repeat protein (TIGR01451 family)/LPXTG-motif cell wall-anchored protein